MLKGKTYKKLDKLKNEIDHTTYLLKGLKAKNWLVGEIELVGLLIKKLPGPLGSCAVTGWTGPLLRTLRWCLVRMSGLPMRSGR